MIELDDVGERYSKCECVKNAHENRTRQYRENRIKVCKCEIANDCKTKDFEKKSVIKMHNTTLNYIEKHVKKRMTKQKAEKEKGEKERVTSASNE